MAYTNGIVHAILYGSCTLYGILSVGYRAQLICYFPPTENVKALYRRGRAHVEVFSPDEARRDLEKASQIDKSIAPSCRKLLAQLAKMEEEKNMQDKTAYSKLFSS